MHGKHYGNKSYTANANEDFKKAVVELKKESSSSESSESKEEVVDANAPRYVFPGRTDYGDADPMPKGFNYGAYKRFNSTPVYKEREKRNNEEEKVGRNRYSASKHRITSVPNHQAPTTIQRHNDN